MSKRHNITLIAGISGVGKSYIIKNLCESSHNFVHFSAGSLIKKRKMSLSRDELRLQNTKDILQNQYLLVSQLHEELKLVPMVRHILFDAHMIVDNDNELLEIPLTIFEQLKPSRIIFLSEEPKIILERRRNDAFRKRPIRSETEILNHQEISKKLVIEYAEILSIPFISTSSNNEIQLKDWLAKY